MKKNKTTKAKPAADAHKAAKKAPKAAPAAKGPENAATPRERDPRLPAAGTTLVRPYKGKDYRVTVLEDGFRYDGREFRSLSKLASEITGQASINGFLWMRLTGGPADAPMPTARKPKGKSAAPTEPAPAADATPDAPSV